MLKKYLYEVKNNKSLSLPFPDTSIVLYSPYNTPLTPYNNINPLKSYNKPFNTIQLTL